MALIAGGMSVAWDKLDAPTPEMNFGRTKADSTRLDEQAPHSHLSHVEVRDMLTDFSNPASGSYYFAPSVECLDASLA